LGDYFKRESIEWSWEFLTSPQWLGIPPTQLAVTCFRGDESMGVGRDTESQEIWKTLGAPDNKIVFLGREDNWWGPAGLTGPCGPDTEIFYYVGSKDPCCSNPESDPKDWVEIWNNVFMQYRKTEAGEYVPLEQKNVDTGMGLERTVAVLNWEQTKGDVYLTDLLKPVVASVEKLSGKKYGADEATTKSLRVVADHIKAAVFIIGDQRGVLPSNLGQGYVVRRLIRRAIRAGRTLGIEGQFVVEIARAVLERFSHVYTNLSERRDAIFSALSEEEQKFEATLSSGLKQFERLVSHGTGGQLTGEQAFDLYQTYGFPIELTQELAHEHELSVDLEGFAAELGKHQDLSRTATAGQFKGGLADHSEEVKRFHTATHLLNQALHDVLGNHVEQRGSNITAERLRFDFVHDAKMTAEQIAKVEEIVNQKILAALPVSFAEMTVDEAKAAGAIGVFGHKYGEMVKVYSIGDYSKEICGGPHVQNTSELGKFKIAKEEAVSQGIRRIKATWA
jgi:alanyl-tRNA synthetase